MHPDRPQPDSAPPTLHYHSGPNDPEDIPFWQGTWRDWISTLITAILGVAAALLLFFLIFYVFDF